MGERMKIMGSAFWNTSIQLSIKDVFNMILGRNIKKDGYIIGVYKMPDNGCQCDECRKYFGCK